MPFSPQSSLLHACFGYLLPEKSKNCLSTSAEQNEIGVFAYLDCTYAMGKPDKSGRVDCPHSYCLMQRQPREGNSVCQTGVGVQRAACTHAVAFKSGVAVYHHNVVARQGVVAVG